MLVSCNENNWNILNLCKDLTNWSVVSLSFFAKGQTQVSVVVQKCSCEVKKKECACVSLLWMDRYLTSVLKRETQAHPWDRRSFSLESERTSQVCKLCFTCLSPSADPPSHPPPQAAWTTSLQNTTVVCSTLNCHSPSQTSPEWARYLKLLRVGQDFRMWMKLPDVTSGGSVGWRSRLQ